MELSEGQSMSVDGFIMSMKKLLGFGLNLNVITKDLNDFYSIGKNSEVSIKGKITLYSREENSTTTITFADGGKITELKTHVFRGAK